MQVGQTHSSETLVTADLLATNVGSGDLRVLSTPAMMALMENAAMLCVAPSLPDDSTTVGSRMNSSHLRPTAEGQTITATATLLNIEGRKLTFAVTASDGKGIIGEGTHVRYIVNRQRFMANLNFQE